MAARQIKGLAVNYIPRPLQFLKPMRGATAATARGRNVVIAVADPILAEQLRGLGGEFPQVHVHDAAQATDARILFLRAQASAAADVASLTARLRSEPADRRTIVVLHDADVATTRALLSAGAADVIPAPASDLALTLCLQRLLKDLDAEARPGGPQQEVVAFLKAGGGVGATALATQSAIRLASQGRSVCMTDLDVQFGTASVYLDRTDALSAFDLLRDEAAIAETPFLTALAAHDSGVRLLAAPDELVSLDSLSPSQVGGLIGALQAQFEITILDLPTAWTAWTNRALELATRIVLVTHLSVPHMSLVNRQLRALAQQGLDHLPVTLVCNAVSADQKTSLPLKAAERAIGRPFDFVLPEEAANMTAAINQGVALGTVKRGSKLDAAFGELAQSMLSQAPAIATSNRR